MSAPEEVDDGLARIEMVEAIDRAVEEALAFSNLSHRDVAEELRRIAQGWEDAA